MLDEFEKSTQKDTSIVRWQGFNEDGKLTVKDGDLSPAVKGVGHKYPNNNSKLILDTAGSVEQRKSSKKKGSRLAANRQVDVKVKAVPVTPFVPRSAIINLLPENVELYEEVFGWILIYHSEDYIESNFNYSQWSTSAEATDDSYDPNYGTSDYNSGSHYATEPTTYGKSFRVSSVYTYIRTNGPIAYPGSASATATIGSLTSTTSASNVVNNYTKVADFDFAIEETNQSQTAVCEAETMIYPPAGTPWGHAVALAQTTFFQFPNAKIYIQWPDDENGSRNLKTLDLNDYVSYPVYQFELLRNFAKVETDSLGRPVTILYHTYSITHVDMTDLDSPVVTTAFVPYVGTVTTTRQYFGKIYRGILLLKTNLSTGSTASSYVPAQGYNNDEYIGRFHHNDNGFSFGASPTFDEDNLGYYNYPQAIWQNAFDGDWISAFSGIAWDATAQANISGAELENFLRISWDSENDVWERGLHTVPPSSPLYSDVNNYDPTTSGRWLNGQPYYNDYRDIENLGWSVAYNPTSTTDLPGVDDFVEITIGYNDTPYVPDYQLEIDDTNPNENDRIHEVRISYVPYPEDQVDENYP